METSAVVVPVNTISGCGKAQNARIDVTLTVAISDIWSVSGMSATSGS